jgi:hypothetical protein
MRMNLRSVIDTHKLAAIYVSYRTLICNGWKQIGYILHYGRSIHCATDASKLTAFHVQHETSICNRRKQICCTASHMGLEFCSRWKHTCIPRCVLNVQNTASCNLLKRIGCIRRFGLNLHYKTNSDNKSPKDGNRAHSRNVVYINWTSASRQYNTAFFIEVPHSRCYGRTAALRLTVQPCDEDEVVFPLSHFNAAPVEWNWQGKTEVLGEKSVPVPRCPPQIPHGQTRDRTWASAVEIGD